MVINRHGQPAPAPILRGTGHLAGDGPRDFPRFNRMPVEVVQGLLGAAFLPDSVPPSQRFHLDPADCRLLYRAMPMLPRECGSPDYDLEHHYDGYVKFLPLWRQ